jgi:distribution and morphology protein 10
MDLVQQCFYSSTGWSWDNTYEHILATPRNLLHFPIPNGVNMMVSNRNTDYNYSSIKISQIDRLEGSLSYLSSSINLEKYYKSSHSLTIASILEGYRDVSASSNSTSEIDQKSKPYLLYGKMYFPTQFLEGMLIKRFSPNYQMILKFVNTPKLNKLTQPTSIFTFYLQRKTENSAHDFIYSTREDLFGFRCLYHFDLPTTSGSVNKAGFISSKLRANATTYPSTFSAGCELWYSIGSVSPGVSVAARYTTYLDSMRYLIDSFPTYKPPFINTPTRIQSNGGNQTINSIPYAISAIHPLTFTIAVNPLLGTVVSTYAIKSDLHYKKQDSLDSEKFFSTGKLGLVLSSKYQFNIYSYDSDLILGAQILRSKIFSENVSKVEDKERSKISTPKVNEKRKPGSSPKMPTEKKMINKEKKQSIDEESQDSVHPLSQISPHNIVYKVTEDAYNESNKTSLTTTNQIKSISQETPSDYITRTDNDDYISSFKLSGSVTKMNLRVSWEGKFHDWLISSGASVDMRPFGAGPKVLKYGVEFAYNS